MTASRPALLCNWTPELEASWRRDPAGVWQTLEEEDRKRKNRPGDQLTQWVSRSVGPFGSWGYNE
jgi:hypothetical protein